MARRKVTRGAPPRLARSNRPRTSGSKAKRSGERAKKRSSGDGDDENFLGMYFREISDLDVMTPEEELESGLLYPAISRLHEVSLQVARQVIKCAVETGLVAAKSDSQIEELLAQVWVPAYPFYEKAPASRSRKDNGAVFRE